MEELEKWKDQISNFEKLNIVEAKELYKKVVSTDDVKLKKLLMDKLILGTLYVVSNYIERNNLKLFCSSSLDMNDIISTFNEIWIKKINNGELLYVENFSFLFNTTFLREVCNILVSEEIVIKEQFGINIDSFIDLFIKFITLKNQAPDFSNKKLMAFNSDNVYNIIELFEKIYNNLDFEEYDDLNLGKTKIFQFLKMIIGLGLTESISDDMAEKTNMEDEVIKEIIFKLFIVDVDLVLKDELQRKIIHKRFGLDNGNQITLEDVAKNYNVTRERVRQIESVSLRKLRKSKEVRNYILIGGI
ncbi:MAG: sigma factor-like helix-turn-helix DNA-binding protein [Clostridia bacterium]